MKCKNAAFSTERENSGIFVSCFSSCVSARRHSLPDQLLVQVESSLEAVNTSAGINELLLTGKERVALGADFYRDILLGGSGLIYSTTSTANGSRLVIRMDSFLHLRFTSFRISLTVIEIYYHNTRLNARIFFI